MTQRHIQFFSALLVLAGLGSFAIAQTAAPAASSTVTVPNGDAPELSNEIRALTSKRIGESTVIRIELATPLQGQAPSFALASPPRLVVDLPNVAHRGVRGAADLSVGDVRSATVAQSGTRSRLMLNLSRSVPYTVFSEGNTVVVVINPPEGKTFPTLPAASLALPAPAAVRAIAVQPNGAPDAQASTAPVASVAPSPVRSMPMPVQREIKNIDFRRGDDGAGKVMIDLTDGSTAIDVRQVGATLVIDVERATLPDALRRRLDVADFATPVQRVSSLQQGTSTRVVIEPKGAWEHSAYQAENRLVVEVRGVKEDPNKLVQGNKVGYKGDKLSLNFQNIDIRSLLQVFADFTNFNIITSDTVQGTVTLRLKDVPWDQALDIVMQSKGLDSRKNGNVVLIAPRDELAAKEKLELEQKSQIANLEPVKSEVFQLQYQKAEDIKKMITESSGGGGGGTGATATASSRFLSSRGSAGADSRTNQLFVTDTPTKLDEVRKLLGKVDIPIRQVLIEARIVEASDTFSKSLGVKLGFNDRRITQGVVGGQIGGNNYGTFAGNQQGVYDLTGQGGTTTGTSIGNTNFVNLPALAAGTNAPASFALSLFGSGLTRFINLELSALEADNKGKIISSPRLVTSDATKAVIESGTEIPYATTSSSGTSVSFKKAVLKLEVTPQITPEGNVILDLQINKDSRGEATSAGPSIDTRNIKTQVLVENGGTVVVGGVYLQEEANQTNKVPLLGDLPFIGALFRNSQRINNKTELLIFITPKVVVNNALSLSNSGK